MPANQVILASGAAVAVSVAVAAAIALYESPELRRYADDMRRRIAVALHAMGENINPPYREPMFNRPEDAQGFLLSQGQRQGQRQLGSGEEETKAEPGVEADEETRRRQREELLYWNSILLEKQEKARQNAEKQGSEATSRERSTTNGSSFDDFLTKDANGEEGSYVFNSGADVHPQGQGLRHRGDGAASRGLTSTLYANPFADEHHIDAEDIDEIVRSNPKLASFPEVVSDIYSATTRDDQQDREAANTANLERMPTLIDLDDTTSQSETVSTATLDRDLAQDEYMTAGQDDRAGAYSSIQAWAQDSAPDFYSPLPTTPAAPVSEPELVSDGQLTPTDSVSLVGSGEDIANEALSSRDGETGRHYDVMSESEGILTPASWSEVGSVVSESDAPAPVRT